jgi:hypothetical protein
MDCCRVSVRACWRRGGFVWVGAGGLCVCRESCLSFFKKGREEEKATMLFPL